MFGPALVDEAARCVPTDEPRSESGHLAARLILELLAVGVISKVSARILPGVVLSTTIPSTPNRQDKPPSWPAGCFLALGSGLGLVGTASARR